MEGEIEALGGFAGRRAPKSSPDMFSTMPRIGAPSCWKHANSAHGIIQSNLCGWATTTAPVMGRSWQRVRGTSPVGREIDDQIVELGPLGVAQKSS